MPVGYLEMLYDERFTLKKFTSLGGNPHGLAISKMADFATILMSYLNLGKIV